MSGISNIEAELLLLEQFNNRDRGAFGKIYLQFYSDLFYFASNLYRGTEISADDVVQDVFLGLWEARKQKFIGIINIKAYLFISIKNKYKDYIKHQKQIDIHRNFVVLDDDYFVSQVAEAEIFSFIKEAVDLLPEECKRVFTEYLNGLDIKEIAKKLNKSEFTVYKQRTNAIKILRNKLPKDKLLIFMILIP